MDGEKEADQTLIITGVKNNEVIDLTDNIKNIFEQNMHLLKELDTAIFYFRQQQYDKALSIVANSVGLMKDAIEAIITDRDYFHLVSTDEVLEMLSGILSAQKKRDYILLADLLELQLVSFLCGVQEFIISKEEILIDEEKYREKVQLLEERGAGFAGIATEPIIPSELLEEGYRVEFTSSGWMTLAAENEGTQFYFHTNGRITAEAVALADHWYNKETERYVIYGFGMGYHLEELSAMAEEAEIEVYESDLNVMKLACVFSDIRKIITNERITIVYDPDYSLLKERLSGLTKKESFHIHYPSYQNIKVPAGRELMEYYIPWSKTLEIG